MNPQNIVSNELVQDDSSVWVLKDHRNFGYSDGAESERYLASVFSQARDLSAGSVELESHIKDWPSEYHLTSKRVQLLSGFQFDRQLKVLEVGCGCGAITRFLGETFDQVVSVEGSLNRARLARQRTRDLNSVAVVCAPFQEIQFTSKFDVVFCIGVLEYSASFVAGDDPYDAALRYFADMLAPNGILIVAIENQFGLKYFNSAREDHLGTLFEGLEGYHRLPNKVRTFGREELQRRIGRYFPAMQFYYPYPDYKLPDCVLAEEFVASGRGGELISQMHSRDYAGDLRPSWEESLVSLELARNGALPFFANSFLVVAGKQGLAGVAFGQQGVLFSPPRQAQFRTRTTIAAETPSHPLRVHKRSLRGSATAESGPMRWRETHSDWIDSYSLQTTLDLRCRSARRSLQEIFEPCRDWLRMLQEQSTTHEGVRYLDGEYVDCTWSNVYPRDGGCTVVDREWSWAERVRLNAVVIRAIYGFLHRLQAMRTPPAALTGSSGAELIKKIGCALGVELDKRDFEAFVGLESRLQAAVFGQPAKRHEIFLRWFLWNRSSLNSFRTARKHALRLRASVRNRIARFA
ncbi:class I SAM-dependent methyltransferase [Peristeroidobacter soli]|uniref:class I SAM-dependent methyltransferase n=1 Tax=Peristeroidobacter soli TaxID=2497877 RepID=UPI00101CAF69|nr:class I SAM-dependent methyltransferase [Peristeroidobacter soli]